MKMKTAHKNEELERGAERVADLRGASCEQIANHTILHGQSAQGIEEAKRYFEENPGAPF